MKLKRLSVPTSWPIEKKTKKYTFAVRPGTHAKENCITLGVIVRDMLKFVEGSKELKKLLNSRQVKVDGKARKESGFPVGLMDVLTVAGKSWRILTSKKGFELVDLELKESSIKLLKVVKKICVKGGKYQLGTHDGRSILVSKEQFDKIKTSDAILYNLEKKSIESVVSFKQGSVVFVSAGKNKGSVGEIKDIFIVKSPQPNRVLLKIGDREIETLKDYVFVVGKDSPIIKLG